MKDWNLNGFKAIVTGGTKGIGKAIVEGLCESGAEVLSISRNEEDLLSMKTALLEKKYQSHIYRADISVPEERQMTIRHIHQLWPGTVHILINNVGTNIRKKAHEYSREDYNSIFRTNLESAFYLSVGLRDLLSESGHGSIVNISSVAGLGHLRTGIVYGMTKAAMIQMTRNLAVEWATLGIRVNAIAPWYIRTPLAEQVLKNDDYRKAVLEHTPMHKIGEPEDVASLALFLCLPAAKYITGQCIAVDGGFSVNLF